MKIQAYEYHYGWQSPVEVVHLHFMQSEVVSKYLFEQTSIFIMLSLFSPIICQGSKIEFDYNFKSDTPCCVC